VTINNNHMRFRAVVEKYYAKTSSYELLWKRVPRSELILKENVEGNPINFCRAFEFLSFSGKNESVSSRLSLASPCSFGLFRPNAIRILVKQRQFGDVTLRILLRNADRTAVTLSPNDPELRSTRKFPVSILDSKMRRWSRRSSRIETFHDPKFAVQVDSKRSS
jgi:hypothetical protein